MSTSHDAAVLTLNAESTGPLVLLCEHASNSIPKAFDHLGLAVQHRDSHAAWDPGAYALSKALSQRFDSPLIASQLSRLLYDCNRPPDSPSAMPSQVELISVPGNRALSSADKAARVALSYTPFCNAVDQLLFSRKQQKIPTALVTIHSFTPLYFNQPRHVEIGLLHDRDTRLADAALAFSSVHCSRQVERNQPYGPEDGVTHSLQKHAISRGLPNLMVEVRNDLLDTPARIDGMAKELSAMLQHAVAVVLGGDKHA